jgi:broad specificity phosphatase PhoE
MHNNLTDLIQNVPVIPQGPKPKERLRGAIDVPLNNQGIMDAMRMAQVLRDKVSCIYSSPLQRATRVANEIRKVTPRTNLIISPELKSWCFGELDGELASRAIPIINEYIINRPYEKLPGRSEFSNQMGESYNEFAYRLLNFMQREIDEYTSKDGTLLYITHIIDIVTMKAWLDDGIVNNLNINPRIMVSKDPTSTSDLLYFNPRRVKIEYVKDITTPGIYIMRHGQTEFNS